MYTYKYIILLHVPAMGCIIIIFENAALQIIGLCIICRTGKLYIANMDRLEYCGNFTCTLYIECI